jgi:hypothetical protein
MIRNEKNYFQQNQHFQKCVRWSYELFIDEYKDIINLNMSLKIDLLNSRKFEKNMDSLPTTQNSKNEDI